jgi:hypothetical protein
MHDKLWGDHHWITWAAMRYCLGRRTYITGMAASWLIEHWPNIDTSAQKIIQRDVEDEFRLDDLARESGATYRPLGDDCDRREWERVRELWTPR